ncbi:hypothetical protein J9303_01695 [Bacillaceae bacterium Marseille-Q3522]|nr:hypothetical protein [Bacillaceae bacterium Marseille-Q3522]
MNNPFVSFSIAMITPFSTKGDLYLDGVPSLMDFYQAGICREPLSKLNEDEKRNIDKVFSAVLK